MCFIVLLVCVGVICWCLIYVFVKCMVNVLMVVGVVYGLLLKLQMSMGCVMWLKCLMVLSVGLLKKQCCMLVYVFYLMVMLFGRFLFRFMCLLGMQLISCVINGLMLCRISFMCYCLLCWWMKCELFVWQVICIMFVIFQLVQYRLMVWLFIECLIVSCGSFG